MFNQISKSTFLILGLINFLLGSTFILASWLTYDMKYKKVDLESEKIKVVNICEKKLIESFKSYNVITSSKESVRMTYSIKKDASGDVVIKATNLNAAEFIFKDTTAMLAACPNMKMTNFCMGTECIVDGKPMSRPWFQMSLSYNGEIEKY